MSRVFISYSRRDKTKAVRLYEDLKFRGLDAWIDFEDIQPGRAWSDEIGQAILDSSHFLLLLSPESVKSEHVRREYEFALEHGCDILPLLLERCDIPEPIAPLQYIDFDDYLKGLGRLLKLFPPEAFTKNQMLENIPAALKSSFKDIRTTVMVLIARGQMFEYTGALIEALGDSEVEVRAAAAWALGELKARTAASALLQAMHDPSADVRSNAGWALVYLGEWVVPQVIEILRDDSDGNARQMAFLVLSHIGSAAALKAIEQYRR
jgi:hypothetical protein